MELIVKILVILIHTMDVEGDVKGTQMKEFWFDLYGEVNHGRPLSEGKNIGIMSRLQCYAQCSKQDSCMSLEIDSSQGRSGACYTFNSFTHNRRMVAASGHEYREKRKCGYINNITALLTVVDAQFILMFIKDKIRTYSIVLTDSTTIDLRYGETMTLEWMFPGVTPPVVAAANGPTPNTVLILNANGDLYLFTMQIHGIPHKWVPNGTVPYLDSFLGSRDVSVSSMVSIDPGSQKMVLITNDNVYFALEWNNVTERYEEAEFDMGGWSGMPENVTGVARLKNFDVYIVGEKNKLYYYGLSLKRVTNILMLCLQNL